MEQFIGEKYWDRFFEFGIMVKAINGLWETMAGFLFLFLSKATFIYWFNSLFYNELLEDSNDRFINFLNSALLNFSSDAKIFIAIYLLAHGILNIFLVIQLYRKKHWAYLAMIATMLIFMTYQIYRISIYHSLFLTVITVFDIIFIPIIWHEYKYHKKNLHDGEKLT